jgi:hypothetical protein
VTKAISAGAADAVSPSISGDWVVYASVGDVLARNLKSGALKTLTTDGITKWDGVPKVSTVDGSYVVWYRQDAGQYDVLGKDLGTNAAPFTVAGGVGNQTLPAIYGKRVAYLDNKTGVYTVWVKTIGSTAAPVHITDNGNSQLSVDIGDHLVVWLSTNASGKLAIRYYDYNTGLYYNGPSSTTVNMSDPQVSGDRIVFSYGTPGDRSLAVFDTRLARLYPTSFIPVASTGNDDRAGRIEGDKLTYLTGNTVYFAKLVVPSISLNTVPKRIPHGGHIHLTGSISDLGVRVSGAKIRVEKYASGTWKLVWTLTANAKGEFTYKTPKTTSKTRYRLAYDGVLPGSGPPWVSHLSTVSSVKTAWPR